MIRLIINDTNAVQGYYDTFRNLHRLQPGEQKELNMTDPSDVIPGIVVEGIQSIPPEGKRKITNIYVDPDINKAVVDYENS